MKLFLVFILFFSLTIQAKNAKNDYPPILDYYPNCAYQVLENKITKIEVYDITETQKSIDELLLAIRKKANFTDADAIILVNKTIKRTVNDANIPMFTIEYEAELIKQCDENSNSAKELTTYNHLGEKIVGTSSSTTLRIDIQTNYTYKSNNNYISRPEITTTEISIENGLYGVKLGDNYENTISILGSPNTVLNILTDELIIGYGRRHWLHFQADKLVKIQTKPPLLSRDIVNEIPFINFFDDFQWKINNKVTYNSQLVNIKKLLNINIQPDKNNQVIIYKNNTKLIMHFENQQDISYVLTGFTLQDNNYIEPTGYVTVDRKKQFNSLDTILNSLDNEQPVDFNLVMPKFGNPLGVITLSKQNKLVIFNNNLLITTRNKDITNIDLVEDILLSDINFNPSISPWYLGKFMQGKSIGMLREYFLDGSFVLNNRVDVNSDKFELSLLFDEYDNDKLYEARLTLYY